MDHSLYVPHAPRIFMSVGTYEGSGVDDIAGNDLRLCTPEVQAAVIAGGVWGKSGSD